ncbi:hypothetical protein ACTFIU_004618 [Dictyostelium citrinum]
MTKKIDRSNPSALGDSNHCFNNYNSSNSNNNIGSNGCNAIGINHNNRNNNYGRNDFNDFNGPNDGFKLSTSVNLSLLHSNIQNLISNNGGGGSSSVNNSSNNGKIAPATNAHPDPLFPSTFRFYLPSDNHSTTINVMSSDTVINLIEKVITKHNNSTKLISSDHAPLCNSYHWYLLLCLKTDELVTNLIQSNSTSVNGINGFVGGEKDYPHRQGSNL